MGTVPEKTRPVPKKGGTVPKNGGPVPRILGPVPRILGPRISGPVPQNGGTVPAERGTVPRISLFVHMDLYRLDGEDEVEAIGWEDYLARGAVIAVEWPERAGALIPSSAIHVRFTDGGDERRTISVTGPDAGQR